MSGTLLEPKYPEKGVEYIIESKLMVNSIPSTIWLGSM